MKTIFSFIVIFELAVRLGTLGASVFTRDCVRELILDKFTQWRSCSSLEVIKIYSIEGEYEGFGIHITYVTGDMQLTGANNFTIKHFYVSPNDLKTSATIHFPMLMLTADHYQLTGRAYYMYSLKGAGFMNVTFQNVEVTFELTLAPKNVKALELDEISLNFNVGKIQVSLADSSWPINKVLNSNAMNIVEKHRSELVAAAKRMLNNVIYEYVASTTPSQLLAMDSTDCTSLSNYIPI